MKKLIPLMAATLLALAITPFASAGAPPKVDPNAPPPEYWEPEAEADQTAKKPKKEKAVKKDKKSDDKR